MSARVPSGPIRFPAMERRAAHRKSATSRWPIVLAVVAALVVVGGGATGVVWVARSHHPVAASVAKHQVLPFDLLATNPPSTAKVVPSATTVTVSLSSPIAPGSPMPSLSPLVAGSWSLVSPSEVEFVPSTPLVPGATETLVVPGGTSGMVSAQGVRLDSSVSIPFSVEPGSILRLQQLLAELGYLPLSFQPTAPMTSLTQEADVQQGTFGWRWPDQPTSLTSLWTPGVMNVITKGAIMEYEDQHGLKTDGLAGPQVWTDLLTDALSGHADANAWDYVYVSETDPESVTVYSDGAVTYKTAANTGISVRARRSREPSPSSPAMSRPR